LVTLIMYMLGEMASARPSLGSFSTYAGQAFGNWARFTMGWLYWFMLIMVMGAEITGAASILGSWFGVDPWIPALAAVVFFAFVNFGAVRGFGEFEFWLAIIKVAVIGALLVLGAWLVFGPAESQAGRFVDNFAPHPVPGLVAAVLCVAH